MRRIKSFLIEYDRHKSRTVLFKTFNDCTKAHKARLALELKRHGEGKVSEIVILEAASKEALALSHSRYTTGLIWKY